MTAQERRIYLELAEKYHTDEIVWKKAYAYDGKNIIEGVAYYVDGFLAEITWRK